VTFDHFMSLHTDNLQGLNWFSSAEEILGPE